MLAPIASDLLALTALLLPAWLFARLPRLRPTALEVVSETLLIAMVLASVTAAATSALGGVLTLGRLLWTSTLFLTLGAIGHLYRASDDPRPRRLALRDSLLGSSEDPASWPIWVAFVVTVVVHGLFVDIDVSARTPLAAAALKLVGQPPLAAVLGSSPPRGAVAMFAPWLAGFGGFGFWWTSGLTAGIAVLFGARLARALTQSAMPSAVGAAIVVSTPIVLMHPAPSPAIFGGVFLVAGLALALDLDAPRVGQAPVPDASPLPVHASVGDVAAAAAFMALALGAAIATYPPALPLALAVIGIVLLTRAPEAPGPAVLGTVGTLCGLFGLAPGLITALALDHVPTPAAAALPLGFPLGARPGLELIASVGTGLESITLLGLWHLTKTRMRIPGCLLAGLLLSQVVSQFVSPLIGRDVEASVIESAFLAMPLGVAGLACGFVALDTWRRAVAVGAMAAALMVLALLAPVVAPQDPRSPMPAAQLTFERTRLSRGYPWPTFALPTPKMLARRLEDAATALVTGRVEPRAIAPMTSAPADAIIDLGVNFPFADNVLGLGVGGDGAVDATGNDAVHITIAQRPESAWLIRTAEDAVVLVVTESPVPGVIGATTRRFQTVKLAGDRLGLRLRSGDTVELRLESNAVPGLEYFRRIRIEGSKTVVGPMSRRGPP